MCTYCFGAAPGHDGSEHAASPFRKGRPGASDAARFFQGRQGVNIDPFRQVEAVANQFTVRRIDARANALWQVQANNGLPRRIDIQARLRRRGIFAQQAGENLRLRDQVLLFRHDETGAHFVQNHRADNQDGETGEVGRKDQPGNARTQKHGSAP